MKNTFSTKVDDSIRLKGMFLSEDGKTYVYRAVRHKGKEPCGKRYILNDLSHRFDADIAHEVLYQDALNVFNKLNENYSKFKEEYLSRFKNREPYKNPKLLNKEKNDLNFKIQDYFEKYAFGELTEEEYRKKEQEIKFRIDEIEKELSEVVIVNSLTIEAIKRLDNFANYLKEIDITQMDKLDFIRTMISKVIVIKINENEVTFKITYRYELEQ